MNRRRLIAATAATALARHAGAAAKPRRAKPQPGDVLVHAFGSLKAQPVAPAEVASAPVFAFPMAAETGLVRDGSLHNQLLLVRVDAAVLSAKASEYAVSTSDGAFLVYSAACTHTGCEVSEWQDASRRFLCPCHGSAFDVHDAGRVVGGPAPKPLAMLPVKFERDRFVVAGTFSRRVGPAPA